MKTVTLLLAMLLVAIPVACQSSDDRLQVELKRLLTGYGGFKRYPQTSPAEVEATLCSDRRRVLHAITRALFAEIIPRVSARLPNPLVIDYLREVRGIWGLRFDDEEGRHQFRLSVLWDEKLGGLLNASVNFPKALNGHVLLPVPGPGGDDDPFFRDFNLEEKGIRTHRQNRRPSIQISYREAEPQIGEVDIDFDTLLDHLKPSNSDPGSTKGNHSHLQDLNERLSGIFRYPLRLDYLDGRNHGAGAYVDAYYLR